MRPRIALLLACVLFAAGCTTAVPQGDMQPIRFIVTGNTSPASPFTGFTERLSQVIERINRENPVFVMHTGNLIHGGEEWMGINLKDINRQLKLLRNRFSRLRPNLYTIAGEKDFYNKSAQYYNSFTKKELNYSFNYGDLHFVVFNNLDDSPDAAKRNLRWLRSDLRSSRNSSGIIVFTHKPLLSPPRQKAEIYKQFGDLHSLLAEYRVRAVFSGNPPEFYENVRDGVRYITAGCGFFTLEDRNRSCYQYYIIEIKKNDILVKGVRL